MAWDKRKWKPPIKFATPPWDIAEKHDEMLDLLGAREYRLLDLQETLGVTPTDEEKKASGKYGHVMGITYLIQMARKNGWNIRVSPEDGHSIVSLREET